MRQLDLFGAVEEKKRETDVAEQPEIVLRNTIAPSPKAEQLKENIVETKPKREIVRKERENKRGRKSYKEMEAEIVHVEVPDDETLFQKKYYAISEVAQWFHVNASLLRYWENEFEVLKPRKTRKGDRLFRPEDVKNLQLIYFLLRQRKFSIEGARQYLKENKKKADMQMQLIQSLTKFRSFLLEWKTILGA
jgi:DNA-binding transcriptional MerR regulator